MNLVRNSRRRAWLAFLAILLLLGGRIGTVQAADNNASALEYKVKAAFLLNFARFVEWPTNTADSAAPMVIGLVGEDPFGDLLPQIVRDQTAQGRRIEIRHFAETETITGCHILFLSRSLAPELEQGILQNLRGQAVLTVGERENFAKQGGMVGFVLVDKTVRFDVNLRTAGEARFSMSSKLLNVARTVIKS